MSKKKIDKIGKGKKNSILVKTKLCMYVDAYFDSYFFLWSVIIVYTCTAVCI